MAPSELANLWDKAVDHLSEDDQQQFDFSQEDKRAALESLLSTVETQKADNINAQLVIRRRQEKPIVLREILAKIVNYINKFKEVGDIITQYDPAHAALPWAAVRLVLQVAVSEQQVYISMIDGSEHVSDVIARYAWIETLYLHASSKMRTQLQDAILKLYIGVLGFLAQARRYYSKRTYQRVFKSLIQFDEQAIQKYQRKISDEEERVNQIARLIDAQYLREISKCMKGGFSSLLDRVGGISQQIAELQVGLSKQKPPSDVEREDLLKWIDATSSYVDFLAAKSARQSNTCDWILERNEFKQWLDQDSSSRAAKILWLYGKHGAGKTIISGRIAEYLLESQQRLFAYFFCSYGNKQKRQCISIVKAWVFQILKQDSTACSTALTIYKVRESNFANDSELWQIFKRITAQVKTCCFLVDGFDECEKDDPSHPKHFLVDAKTRFLTELNDAVTGTGAQIIIVSRPDYEIRDQLQDHSQNTGSRGVVWTNYEITLQDTSDDLMCFARAVMNLKIPNRDSGLQLALASDAAGKADGMFLWIRLLHPRLSRSKSPATLRKIITDTPSGLDQAYERDLMYIINLEDDERDRAVALLRWTLFAFHPVTIRQLAEALLVEFKDDDQSGDEGSVAKRESGPDCLDSDEEFDSEGTENDRADNYLPLAEAPDFGDDDSVANDFLKACGSLLELRGKENVAVEDRTVHFVHFSVQEYLLKAANVNFPTLNELRLSDRALSHEKLALVNLQYLLYDDFRQKKNSTVEQFNEKKARYALLEYAGAAWGWHANCCQPLPQTIIKLCNQLLDPHNHKWISYSEIVGGRANGSFARFMARFGDSYPSPLFYASLWGIVETMQFLMDERSEDVNHVGGLYGSPLKAASAHGHGEAVNLLLARGAEVDLNGGQFGTALQTAAAQGKLKVVEILIDHSSDINLKGGWWSETPLLAASQSASRKSAEAIVEQLLNAGANCNAADEKGATALHMFAANGTTSILKLLVKHQADVNHKDSQGCTPLLLAIQEGRQSAAEFLMQTGMDVNIQNNDGETALHLSAEMDHFNFARILLEHGADPNVQNENRETPLHVAAREGSLSVAKVLLDHGADHSIRNRSGESEDATALHLAVERGDSFLVDILLAHGAEANALDAKAQTPLHVVAHWGDKQTMQMMLNPNQKDDDSTEQEWSARQEVPVVQATLSIVSLLLKHGGDIESKDQDGQTPLVIVEARRGIHRNSTSSSTIVDSDQSEYEYDGSDQEFDTQ